MSFLRRRSLFARIPAFLVLSTLAGFSGCRIAEGDVASKRARVLDAAHILSTKQRMSIEHYLAWVVSERGVDYRVVVLGRAPDDLARESASTYERLEIGSDTDGRGLLLFVDVGTGEARVEVGYALEHRIRDAEASSMIGDFLAPYFASSQAAMGIEASVERLVDVLEPSRDDSHERPVLGSGGAGATEELLEGIESLTPKTKARLQVLMVPQPQPEDCLRLEMALMKRGIYYRNTLMYDEAWRSAVRPDLPAQRLKDIARDWSGPFSIERTGDYAITYFVGEKAERFGPHFLRRTTDGWIIDASATAEYVVYDYSNRAWFAIEDDYPYLELVRRAYDMKRVSLRSKRIAWMIDWARESSQADTGR